MGPKKPKKSKAELEEERLAREEEERKAKIAEEKRNAEENEKRRLEELRIQAEQKLFRENELERLKTEYVDFVDEKKGADQQLLAEERKEAQRLEWLKYKDPSDEPDANVDSDMNTFITLTNETNVNDIKEAVDLVKTIEKVAGTVEDVWSDSLAKGDSVVQSRALGNLRALKGMMLEKLDNATISLLRIIDKHLNDRAEFNCEEVGDRLSVGMWASYNDIRPIRKQWQLERMGIKMDIIKQVLQQNEKFLFRLVRIPVDTYNLECYTNNEFILPATDEEGAVAPQLPAVNTRYVVGDLILFDILLSTPPAFHLRARKWTMRDRSVLSTTLRRSPYPSSVPSKVYLTVPDDVVMSDSMRIVVWNEELKDWTEDGVTEYQYSESNRLVQFYINTVGVLALVKSRVVDFPYKKFSLSPVLDKKINHLLHNKAGTTAAVASNQASSEEKSEDASASPRNDAESSAGGAFAGAALYEKQAQFIVQTQKHEIVIDIVGAGCRLVKPNTKNFSDLIGVMLSPGCLLSRLQRKGVNLLPTAADLHNINGWKPKDPVVEDCVNREIARGASSLDFHSSPWNQTISEKQIGVLVRESTVYTCPGEDFAFECVLAEADEISQSYKDCPELGLVPGPVGLKYALVFGDEYKEKKKFSHVLRPNEVTHIELIKTLSNRVTPECTQRYNDINQRFQKTVYTLLSLVKPYSLS